MLHSLLNFIFQKKNMKSNERTTPFVFRDTIRSQGKRCYTFLVGKPNPAKLANFPEVGWWSNRGFLGLEIVRIKASSNLLLIKSHVHEIFLNNPNGSKYILITRVIKWSSTRKLVSFNGRSWLLTKLLIRNDIVVDWRVCSGGMSRDLLSRHLRKSIKHPVGIRLPT